MNAIAEKRDPSAADALIEMFSHPGRFTPHLAAIAVARIGSNKEIPKQTRMQIFSKISSLIGHDDPWVRSTAATALGYIGGERAGAEVMRLLQDPEDFVRQNAVFVLGFLAYRPALEAVRRVARDPVPMVRARRELPDERPHFDARNPWVLQQSHNLCSARSPPMYPRAVAAIKPRDGPALIRLLILEKSAWVCLDLLVAANPCHGYRSQVRSKTPWVRTFLSTRPLPKDLASLL